MGRKRAFISFDFDHDDDLRVMLAGQADLPDTPFDFIDKSLKEPLTGDWRAKIRGRISRTDFTIVVCGEWTHTATGVADELAITRELRNPYFLLAGRANKSCYKPTSALPADKVYTWSWPNLKALIAGQR